VNSARGKRNVLECSAGRLFEEGFFVYSMLMLPNSKARNYIGGPSLVGCVKIMYFLV
jgi:hypothetical protein